MSRPIQRIFTGTALGCTEGPHLYRREGWYYLMTAEGGSRQSDPDQPPQPGAVAAEGRSCLARADARRVVYGSPLRLDLHRTTLRFSWSWDGETWQNLGPALDAGRLSDEGGKGWHFTGAFIGLACHDMSGRRRHADFDYFDYDTESALVMCKCSSAR